jgi:hypothetical protein
MMIDKNKVEEKIEKAAKEILENMTETNKKVKAEQPHLEALYQKVMIDSLLQATFEVAFKAGVDAGVEMTLEEFNNHYHTK